VGHAKVKVCELIGSKHFPDAIFSWLLTDYRFDFLLLFPSDWTLLCFEKFY